MTKPKKRTWLKVRQGLITDPKHRKALGVKIWLLLYMLNIADWKTGRIPTWKDHVAAAKLDMPIKTIREQRKGLNKTEYITCTQYRHHQHITINKWSNPRLNNKKNNNHKESSHYWEALEENNDPGLPLSSPQGIQNREPLHIDSHLNLTYELKDKEKYALANQLLEIWTIKTGLECTEKLEDIKATANAFERAGVSLTDYAQAIDDLITMDHIIKGPTDTLNQALMLSRSHQKYQIQKEKI